MFPTLILPGLNGSPEGHWQRHWATEHSSASIVEQQDWNCPVIEDWQAELDRALSVVEGAFLVAHSLGCLLAAVALRNPELAFVVRAGIIAAFMLLTTAVAAHVIARAAARSGAPIWKGTLVDERPPHITGQSSK